MLDPGEPVAVLHTSANGYFYYVQAVNYSGWVSKYNVAMTDKNTWSSFVKPQKFLVVTDAEYNLKTDGEQVLYQQGARCWCRRLPLPCITVICLIPAIICSAPPSSFTASPMAGAA